MTLNEIAAKYIGITEKPNNGGFSDPEFERRMKKDGEWQKGWAWCCCFVQLCVMEWLNKLELSLADFEIRYRMRVELCQELDKAITPSVKVTMNNLLALGYVLHKEPKVGDLVIWLNYKNNHPKSTGHIGIVNSLFQGEFKDTPQRSFESIEGNTNTKGEREGDSVAFKTRYYPNEVPNGLRLMGFIRLEDKL